MPHPVKSSAPLPVARCLIRSLLIRLVPRPGLRLARRLVLMPSRLIVPFLVSSRLVRCAERLASRLAVAPFCPAHLAVLTHALPSSRRLMTR